MTATGSNIPNGRKTYVDQNGKPLAGASVTYYVPDTTELSTVYLDETMTTLAENPVVLDAAGSCSLYAAGVFREYVQDAEGNLISDEVVIANTPLRFTEAMRPVLEAATPADAEKILVGDGLKHLEIKPGDQTLTINPTGNLDATKATFNVQGTTLHPTEREFLANIGFTSNVGADTALTLHGAHKVGLYCGMSALAGTGAVWSMNPLLTMEPDSGSYNAQGIELDFNNFDANRGASGFIGAGPNDPGDFDSPIAVGLSITGAGRFSSTSALVISSSNDNDNHAPQWNRGITLTGTMGIATIHNWANAPVGIQFDGEHLIAAINLTAQNRNIGARTNTAMFMKAGQALTWQSPDLLHVVSDFLDTANNRYVGASSNPNVRSGIILGGTTIPQVDGLFQLGATTNRWGDFHGTNLRLFNQGGVYWDNSTRTGAIIDYVDNTNNRVVGTNAAMVYVGAPMAPQTPGYNLGTAVNPWGTIYSNGAFHSSSVLTNANVATMAVVPGTFVGLTLVEQIDTLRFTWSDGRDARLHYSLNPNQVRDALPATGAYIEKDGVQYLSTNELLAVAWQAIKDLQGRVNILSFGTGVPLPPDGGGGGGGSSET